MHRDSEYDKLKSQYYYPLERYTNDATYLNDADRMMVIFGMVRVFMFAFSLRHCTLVAVCGEEDTTFIERMYEDDSYAQRAYKGHSQFIAATQVLWDVANTIVVQQMAGKFRVGFLRRPGIDTNAATTFNLRTRYNILHTHMYSVVNALISQANAVTLLLRDNAVSSNTSAATQALMRSYLHLDATPVQVFEELDAAFQHFLRAIAIDELSRNVYEKQYTEKDLDW